MAIGYLGDIVFLVSEKEILTFENLRVESSSRWAEYPVQGDKSFTEFKGPNTKNCTLNITFDAQYGVTPVLMYEKIHNYCEDGTPISLVVGGRRIGAPKHVVKSVSSSFDIVLQHGEVLKLTTNITLMEYRQ